MQPKPPTEKEAAAILAAYLFTPQSNYRDSAAPVVDIVNRRIRLMADEIAAELVAANEELVALIRSRVQQTIARALADDPALNQIVTKSVAEALTRHYANEMDG